MASLRIHPKSKYFYACITLPDGRQTQKSTKVEVSEKNRRKAMAVAEGFEQASLRCKQETQFRKVLSDLYALNTGETMATSGTKPYLEEWLSRKRQQVGKATFDKYGDVISKFISFLGEKATKDLSLVSNKDIILFRDFLASKLKANTANVALKIIRMPFLDAERDGLILSSPAKAVPILKSRQGESTRRPFTIPELKRIMKCASAEWKTIIATGLYTGQRLGDIAKLTWLNVDLEEDAIYFQTTKTGRRQALPLVGPLKEVLMGSAGDRIDAPLFPHANEILKKHGRTGPLSAEFHRILELAGLADSQSKRETGKGKSVMRTTSPLSFHSLRHTTTTVLKKAGVSAAVVQDIIGHESAAVSRHYTHIDLDSKRTALSKVPDLFEQEGDL